MTRSVDEFLAALPADQREALQDLRAKIRSAAPDAIESINYGVPAFKLGGRPLVSFGAAKAHCTFYLQSTVVVNAHAGELAPYRLGKGSVQFAAGERLPAELVTRLVQARIDENEERYGQPQRPRR